MDLIATHFHNIISHNFCFENLGFDPKFFFFLPQWRFEYIRFHKHPCSNQLNHNLRMRKIDFLYLLIDPSIKTSSPSKSESFVCTYWMCNIFAYIVRLCSFRYYMRKLNMKMNFERIQTVSHLSPQNARVQLAFHCQLQSWEQNGSTPFYLFPIMWNPNS